MVEQGFQILSEHGIMVLLTFAFLVMVWWFVTQLMPQLDEMHQEIRVKEQERVETKQLQQANLEALRGLTSANENISKAIKMLDSTIEKNNIFIEDMFLSTKELRGEVYSLITMMRELDERMADRFDELEDRERRKD